MRVRLGVRPWTSRTLRLCSLRRLSDWLTYCVVSQSDRGRSVGDLAGVTWGSTAECARTWRRRSVCE